MKEAPSASIPESVATELDRVLRSKVRGEVRFDRLHRAMYATDASMYQIVPVGVVMPKDADDVAATVRACGSLGVPIVARGAGTGLTGGAVGPGLQVDFSRHLDRVGPVDPDRRTVVVEPGVVLDELNTHLRPLGLRFAPDVATSSRATIGGMIANNSCGAGSVLYGRTVDHVLALRCVLSSGEVVEFGARSSRRDDTRDSTTPSIVPADSAGTTAARLEFDLAALRNAHYAEILERFPKVLRSNGGYGLDRLGPPGTRADACKVLCGSEGTLALVIGAALNLVPVPRHTALCVLHFSSVLDAVSVTPAILRHRPAAVELIDRLILDAARGNSSLASRCRFLSPDAEALLVVELHEDDPDALRDRLASLEADRDARCAAFAVVPVTDPEHQSDVWRVRTSGLGLLMSKPGDEQPYSFVEDTAVKPERLAEYLARFAGLLDREGVPAGYYAHASVGCIHVKPVLNLRSAEGVETMRRIADAVADLALEFGGALTGEHGDGIVRSCFLERIYGKRIVQAFREVKQRFDPHNLFNPHKIVDPWPMTEHLRFRHDRRSAPHTPALDFSLHVVGSARADVGNAAGMAALAGKCSGVGQCRQRLVGTMCPSYAATGDEIHTTRGRANALRMALSDQGLLQGLDDPALDEVMDLCLSCKACRTECPTGVDMARLKAEFRHRRNLVHGSSRRARFLAEIPDRLSTGSRLPRLANAIVRTRLARWWMQQRYQLDARLVPPEFAVRTFHQWFRTRKDGGTHRKSEGSHDDPRGPATTRGTAIYFVDCWTNFFAPQTGIAAVRLLEAAGVRVVCPQLPCCGRAAISQGFLLDAKQRMLAMLRALAEADTSARSGLGTRGVPDGTSENRALPILGSEPSCLLTLVDEGPQLVRTPYARRVAKRAMLVETFLARLLENDPQALRFSTPAAPLLYHAHCHQKAWVGSQDAVACARAVYGKRASEINSGCCGMAGAFGHEREHYEIARAVGEQRLFPAVRQRGDAVIAVSGFSCRQQIEHHTDARPRHLLELLADHLLNPSST